MASFHPDAWDKAVALGAKAHSEGINWDWVSGFPDKVSAEAFDKWCLSQGYETRGVYSPMKEGEGFDVRFRKDSDIVW